MLKFFANFFLQVVRCRFRLDTLCHHVSMHWGNKNTWAKFILLVTLVYSSLGATVATNFFSVHSNWNYLKNIAFSKAPKKPSQKNFSKNASPIFPARKPQTQYMQRNERGRLTGRLCAKESPWSIAHSEWASWAPKLWTLTPEDTANFNYPFRDPNIISIVEHSGHKMLLTPLARPLAWQRVTTRIWIDTIIKGGNEVTHSAVLQDKSW